MLFCSLQKHIYPLATLFCNNVKISRNHISYCVVIKLRPFHSPFQTLDTRWVIHQFEYDSYELEMFINCTRIFSLDPASLIINIQLFGKGDDDTAQMWKQFQQH